MNLKENKLPWNCTDIAGVTSKMTPKPCALLLEKQGVNCDSPQKIETVMRERERKRLGTTMVEGGERVQPLKEGLDVNVMH